MGYALAGVERRTSAQAGMREIVLDQNVFMAKHLTFFLARRLP